MEISTNELATDNGLSDREDDSQKDVFLTFQLESETFGI